MSHPCTDGAFMKGTQIGGSEALYNAIGYIADQVPCPIMLVMPTTDTGKRVSKQRLQPMIDETPCLRTKFAEVKSRVSSNTVLMKDFPGGVLVITGANSGPGLRSMPVRVLLQDEIDAYPDDVDGEGDPSAVADKRTDTYARAKRIKCSTPKIKGISRIDRLYQAGTRARYYVPCPHCQHEQNLRWDRMRWELMHRWEAQCAECGGISEIDANAQDAITCRHCQAGITINDSTVREVVTDEIERVWYECEGCGEPIQEHHKTSMLEQGRHIHHAPGPGMVLEDHDPDPHALWAMVRGEVKRFLPNWTKPLSWHVSALYSPLGWFSWHKAVRQYLDAQQGGHDEGTGESLMQVFENTVNGEPFETAGEQPKINVIKQRVENYQLGEVPAGGLLLVAGVDVQGDRLEVGVDAFGRGEECWTIDYQIIHGDPRKIGPGSVWDALLDLRMKSYPHAGGSTLRITAMGIDSGFYSQDVYHFCRVNARFNIFAIDGLEGAGRPALGKAKWWDVTYKNITHKKGVQKWPVGTFTIKQTIYDRLGLDEPGPRYYHFPRGLPDEYFEQLLSEKLTRERARGVERQKWKKTRARNEALDTKVYCYAAGVYAGMYRAPWDLWDSLLNPVQHDMFARKNATLPPARHDAGGAVSASPPVPPAVPQPQQPASSGFFNAPKTRRMRSTGITAR